MSRLVPNASPNAPTIRIEYFHIAEEGWACSVLTRAQAVELLRQELIRYFTELGFRVVDDGAEYRVTGEFTSIDEGNRLLRGLLPGILGAARVEASARITRRNQVVKEFDLRQRKASGFQGGSSKGLLELSIRQIAMRIGSDTGVTTEQIAPDEAANAMRYLGILTGVAGLVAVVLGWLAYQWLAAIPVRRDGIQDGEKPFVACFFALALFVALFLLGLALAPDRILKSRTLLFLRASSGVKSIAAPRIVIALLALPALGLILLFYACCV